MKMAKNRHQVARRMAAGFSLAVLMTAGSSAWALDKIEIMNMQTMGLNPSTIVSVIQNSAELNLTPADVEELRAAGAAPEIIGALCERIACATGGGGPMGPVGPGPGLDQELRRQQELEAERQRLETERLAAEREAMRQQLAAQAAATAGGQQAFLGVREADRAYDRGRYVEAAALYDEYIRTQNPATTSADYHAALSGFVRSLYAAGYRQIIRQRALEVVLLGATRPGFEEMFGILADITNSVNYLDPQFETLTSFSISNFDAAFQQEFNFFLGRFFWTYGETTRAREYLGRVTGGPKQGKAHYLAGVIALDLQENRLAAQQFQQAVAAGQAVGDSDVVELANLALARMTFEVTQYDAALYYYQKVADASFRHPTAMFESAWAYYLKGDWNRAIGTMHSLHSPYYNTRYYPDLRVIEAAAYFQVCQLEDAESALEAFYREANEIQRETQTFISNATSPNAYWEAVMSFYDTLGTANAVALPIEAVRAVIGNVEFRNQAALMNQLELERRLLDRDAARLGTFGSTAQSGLSADLQNKSIESGLKVAAMIREFSADVANWQIKAQEVGLEVTTAKLDLLDAQLEGTSGTAAGTTTFVLAADWQAWPWEGEYWLDEVDNYRGSLNNLRDPSTNRCTAPPAPAPAP